MFIAFLPTHAKFLGLDLCLANPPLNDIRDHVSPIEQQHFLLLCGWRLLSHLRGLLRRSNHHVMKPVTLQSLLPSLRLNCLFQLFLLNTQVLQLPENLLSFGMDIGELLVHLYVWILGISGGCVG